MRPCKYDGKITFEWNSDCSEPFSRVIEFRNGIYPEPDNNMIKPDFGIEMWGEWQRMKYLREFAKALKLNVCITELTGKSL